MLPPIEYHSGLSYTEILGLSSCAQRSLPAARRDLASTRKNFRRSQLQLRHNPALRKSFLSRASPARRIVFLLRFDGNFCLREYLSGRRTDRRAKPVGPSFSCDIKGFHINASTSLSPFARFTRARWSGRGSHFFAALDPRISQLLHPFLQLPCNPIRIRLRRKRHRCANRHLHGPARRRFQPRRFSRQSRLRQLPQPVDSHRDHR